VVGVGGVVDEDEDELTEDEDSITTILGTTLCVFVVMNPVICLHSAPKIDRNEW
jgi:hypothetical protein